jgi:phosphohistidine phosphatase
MLLYVMRHGPAEDRSATGRDFDRALTADGRVVVEQAAETLLRARGGSIPRVLASPYTRARETAAVVRSILGAAGDAAWPEVEVRDELGAEEGLPLRLVREVVPAGADAILVGHQPTVEELTRSLVHPARPSLPRGFRTAMIATLELLPAASSSGGDRFRLLAVLDPHS